MIIDIIIKMIIYLFIFYYIFRCRKPYHSPHFFQKDKEQVRCNACFEKLQKEREKRTAVKRTTKDVVLEDDEESDVETPPQPLPKISKPTTVAGPSLETAHKYFSKSKMGYIPIFFK